MPTIFIMQGIPGSGKSTKAKELARKYNAVICSTDDFHQIDDKFQFQPDNIGAFHAWNQWEVEYHLKNNQNVIVDNTNILKIHVESYFQLARKYKCNVSIVPCHGNYKSIHNVPQETIDWMKSNMETLIFRR